MNVLTALYYERDIYIICIPAISNTKNIDELSFILYSLSILSSYNLINCNLIIIIISLFSLGLCINKCYVLLYTYIDNKLYFIFICLAFLIWNGRVFRLLWSIQWKVHDIVFEVHSLWLLLLLFLLYSMVGCINCCCNLQVLFMFPA